ncbi:Fimbrial protein [compost metagenome]
MAGVYPYVGYTCNANGNLTNGGQIRMRLISTGLIEAGTLASSTPVMGYSVINNVPGSPGTGNKSFTISSVNFVALSCSVDNINVKLDDVKKSDFASATSLKTKAFAFTLKSCPAGMNTIQYRLDPLGTVISSTDGTFANATGPDMAQGVGLRITDSANTAAVRLGDSSYVVSGYSPASGNSSLTIPMNVSYYRTGAASAVTPGKVSGVAQLTVYYK